MIDPVAGSADALQVPAGPAAPSFYPTRFDPGTDSPTGQNVIEDCNPEGGAHPDTWATARGTLLINERSGNTQIKVVVRKARPNTFFTLWLRLRGTDSEGNTYAGNPLTGIGGTPLVPTSDLPNQLAITPPHPGSDDVVHGFYTNRNGYGRVELRLDFPITDGAYPFQRFPDFDALKGDIALTNPVNAGRLGGAAPALRPVAIQDGTQAPFTIRVASHCTDDVVHGLVPGPHENWFDWKAAS